MRTRRRIPPASLAATLVAAWLASGCAFEPQRPDTVAPGDYASVKAYVTALIRAEMKRHDVAGLSLALVDDQRVVWSEGFGFADRERGVPASERTVYRVGSISKLFTDTAVMQLAEAGRLDIDAPFAAYVSEFPLDSDLRPGVPLTARMLMTHHAGLPRDRLKGFMTSRPASFDDLPGELTRHDGSYAPGTVFSYSNLGVSMLGTAIERVGGMPFAAFMQERLLSPLGMRDSSFEGGPSVSPLMAQGYEHGRAAPEPPLRDVPAGGLNASAVDMARFIAMQFADGRAGDRQVVRAETVAEMFREQNAGVPLDFDFRVGIGWMLSTFGASTIRDAGPVAHHAGATALFRSQMYVLPAHKLGVVVLANSGSAAGVVDRVATEALALALQAKTGIRQPPPRRPDAPPGAPDDAALAAFPGDYTTLAGFVHVERRGTSLRATAMGRTFQLVPAVGSPPPNDAGGAGPLRLDYVLLGILHPDLGAIGAVGLIRRDVGSHELLLALADGRAMLVGERLGLPAHRAEWRTRLGSYEIVDLGDDHRFVDSVRLVEEDGQLLVEMQPVDRGAPAERIVLSPESATVARLLGPLRDGGDVVRVESIDGHEVLAFSGYHLRRREP